MLDRVIKPWAYFLGTVAGAALTARQASGCTCARTAAGLFTITYQATKPIDQLERLCFVTVAGAPNAQITGYLSTQTDTTQLLEVIPDAGVDADPTELHFLCFKVRAQ